MSDTVAFRYAKVFHSLAQGSPDLNEIVAEVALITQVYQTSKEFEKGFMERKDIPLSHKIAILEKIIQKKLVDPTSLFLSFLEYKKRLAILEQILYFFDEFQKESNNILEVELTKSVGLRENFEEELKKVLERKYSKKIKLVVKENKSLIGGFLLKIGDVFYDLSIRGRLASYESISI